MRYEDFKNETAHAHKQLAAMLKGAQRDWITKDSDGKPLLLISVQSESNDRDDYGARVRISRHETVVDGVLVGLSMCVSKWRATGDSDDGYKETHKLRDGRVIEGGCFEYAHSIEMLSSLEIRQIAAARSTIEAWTAGELADLPLTLL